MMVSRVKSESIVQDVLDDLGVEYNETNSDYIISCPHHDENTPSYHIDKVSGVNHCFSCHEKGTFIKLIMVLTQETYMDVMLYLSGFSKSFFGGDTGKDSLQLLKDKIKRTKSIQDEGQKSILLPHTHIFTHPYLVSRGITEAEIAYHNMSVVSDSEFKGWIQIPIYKDKILRTYFLRDPKGIGKIYGFYKVIDPATEDVTNVGYPRKDILYGMDDCTDYNKPIAISEGIFDSIFNKRILPQSVACLSNNLLPDQLEFLRKFKTIYVIPDNDVRGLFLVKTILPLCYNHDIYIVQLPAHKKDSATCTIQELAAAFSRPIGLIDFMVSQRYLEFNIFLNQLKQKNYKKR